MPYANIQANFSDADKEIIIQNLVDSREKMDFLINLTQKDRRKRWRMSGKIDRFITKTIEYAELKPSLIPAAIDIPGLKDDDRSAQNLKSVQAVINSLGEAVDDTLKALRKEAFDQARVIYAIFVLAEKNNVPGMTEIVNDLKQHFPRTGKKNKKQE